MYMGLTFDPEVIFEGFSQSHGTLVVDERVVVDGDSPQTWHPVQVRSPITQTVLPRFSVSLGCLVL